MRAVIVELIVNAIAVIVITSGLFPGIRIDGAFLPTALTVAIIFAVVNVVIKPILKILTCPLIFFTLGAIVLVIDGVMLLLTAALSDVFAAIVGGRLILGNGTLLDALLWAIIGAFIMGVIEAAIAWVLDRLEDRDPRVRPRETQTVIRTQRAQADSQFDALLTGDAPARRTREGDGSRFDFYDPDSGKPR